ncbi:thioesterase II family protein [Chitinophaga flava]|uniref:Thioesterase domain-containing protein n=1 Tax=Chitinophaga flava TaxID=2259036 RepID=A0A365XVI7_9BACT|nr:alpha/beta fold hydrolase [Chitinophaga flava]RBL90382.1 hypothetical protein DF182_28380 [Chitinophaga flava]
MRKINLVCFPFAGGNIYSYDEFTKFLPDYINLITIEYPGRGSRIGEDLINDMEVLIEDLLVQFKALTIEGPYVIYGHSMGAVVSYLMVRKILENQLEAPLAVFLTGAGSIVNGWQAPIRYNLSREDFIKSLALLGGLPEEILGNSDFMEFYVPIFRADIEALEKCRYKETTPFNIPMYVVTGKEENVSPQQALLWKNETTADFEYTQLPGQHFFIFSQMQPLLAYIRRKIDSLCEVAGFNQI